MNWSGEKILQTSYPKKTTDVKICAFRIVDDYVLFSLHRTENDTLEFPTAKTNQALDVIGKELNPTFLGTILHEGDMYVWYHCQTDEKYQPLFVNKSERKWWALSSEIVNWQYILHFPIVESVVNLFLAYPEMLFVEDMNKEKQECPIVGYRGGYYTEMFKEAIIGVPRHEYHFSSLGPFFYFGDYNAGVRYALSPSHQLSDNEMYHAGEKIIRENGNYTRGGLIRFALHVTNNHSLMLGTKRDRSEKTRQGIKTGRLRSEDAYFRDTNGEWTKTFDAVSLGRRSVMSSTGKMKTLHPLYAIKKFYQHVPLSYHYLDTSSENAQQAMIE